MKKVLIMTSIVCLMMSAAAGVVYGEEKDSQNKSIQDVNLAPEAESAILIERDTGKVLYKKNPNKKLPPASMTKVMSLLLIMEALETGKIQKDEMIRVSERAASMGGSQIFLEEGEKMSVNNLLKGIAIASGNDATVALAERIAGSEEAFVKQMNKKAKELGLEDTHFNNSTGLPAENHYTTVHDMSVMAKELLKYESITNYTSIYEDYLRKGQENEFWLVNTNKLVKSYPGVDGLKTGYTNEAEYCLTATAERNGMRIIAVVMGADSTKERNSTVSNMLDYAFNHFETKNLYKKGEKITTLNLLKAENQNTDVVTSESISTIHRKGESTADISSKAVLSEDIQLPLKKGDKVGTLIVKKDGKAVSKSPLILKSDVQSAGYFTLLKRALQNMVKNN